MKFLSIMTLAMLLPLSLATTANAEPGLVAPESVPISPNADSPTLDSPQPAPSESIQPLSVGQDSQLVSPSDRSVHLEGQAQQINRNLNAGQNTDPRLRDLLDLPDGMIIRGSSRGGIGIGREY